MSVLHNFGDTVLETEQDITMLRLLITALFLLLLTVLEVWCACGRAEYLAGQECCPMCGAGYYVRRNCTEYTSTTCAPCLEGSYTDTPNGLEACRACLICDFSAGLRVKRACTSSSDALCEPLEGYYCIDPMKDGCQGAVEHTKCLPGKYIKRPGTATLDAQCDDCVGKTYSDGTFTFCKPHTECEVMGLEVLTEGSSSQDTECGERSNNVALIVGIIIAVVPCGAGLFVCLNRKRRKKNNIDRPDKSETVSLNMPEGTQEENKDCKVQQRV